MLADVCYSRLLESLASGSGAAARYWAGKLFDNHVDQSTALIDYIIGQAKQGSGAKRL